MDGERFDAIARTIAAGKTRRAALPLLLGAAGALLGGLAGGEGASAASCRGDGDCGRCRQCHRRDGERRGRCVATPPGSRCGACGRCDRDGRCTPDDDRCGRCLRCDPRTATCVPVPAGEREACGECRVCRDGQCESDAALEGQPCRECGECRGGACAPVHGRCGGSEEACSYCRQDKTCAAPQRCAPCEICTQEGCARDDALRWGEGRVCCGDDVCCQAGQECVNGVCQYRAVAPRGAAPPTRSHAVLPRRPAMPWMRVNASRPLPAGASA